MSSSDSGGLETRGRTYRSSVTPDRTLTVGLRVAGTVGIVALIFNALVDTGESESRIMVETISGLILCPLVLLSSFLLAATAKVTSERVALRCAWIFTAKIPIADINHAADDSNFPAVGYGYRVLGKNHRGFIMGGPQATLVLHDGRQYTVSVESVDVFCAAVNQAVERLHK